jgi:anaerobic dimethyl sulfoxide reductase subunit A
LAGCTYTDTDGEKKPLLTITQEDVDRLSAEAGETLTLEPQEGVMDMAEFEAKGGFQIPNPEEYVNLPFKDYIDDPEGHPLNTPSGKFEIHCQLLSDYIEWIGFSSKSPLPLYKRITEGYEDGVENELPFQFINHHYQRRSHHVFDNLTWLREAFPQELWINTDDAKKLDIKTGDIVLVEGTRGKIARPAYVTERIAPGVISVGEGAWAELNKDGVDIAGAANTLTSWLPTGQGHSGYNSNNTKISKYEDQSLLPDAEWEKRIIFPEA